MSLIAKEPKVSEDHWYDRDGLPVYTITNDAGKSRSTTLRDARKMNLVPSVTTIMKLINKPALTQWMQTQVLLSALTLPKRSDESESQYIDRILDDSKAQGRAAADKGTAIHGAIEAFYSGQCVEHYASHVLATTNAIAVHFGEQGWVAERSFAHDLGFGGKVDMFASGVVVDIKTQDFLDPKTVKVYDEHVIQLAAYRVGLGMPAARCANVYVSRTHPDQVVVYEWEQKDIERGWEMFCSLLKFWQIKTGHQ
tara:strand:+ start:693 stop:1451 length:759 start_codon:yes stop_codon:yes gene_type:complete